MKQGGKGILPVCALIKCIVKHVPGTCSTVTVCCLLLLAIHSGPVSQVHAGNSIRADCRPQTFRVVPGEAVRLRLTLQTDTAVHALWYVPEMPMLKLRATEKLPVRRTRAGIVVYQRLLIWQAVEPGEVKLKSLSVEVGEEKLLFPEVTITVRDPGP